MLVHTSGNISGIVLLTMHIRGGGRGGERRSRGESHLRQMNGKFVASYSSLMGQYDLRRVSINFALSPIRLKVSSCSGRPLLRALVRDISRRFENRLIAYLNLYRCRGSRPVLCRFISTTIIIRLAINRDERVIFSSLTLFRPCFSSFRVSDALPLIAVSFF